MLCAGLVILVEDSACVMRGFRLFSVWGVVCTMCGRQYVLFADCSQEPRRFAPSMARALPLPSGAIEIL